jgi:hypothetical protein
MEKLIADWLALGYLRLTRPRRYCVPHTVYVVVARAQGGLTLGPERGELDADFRSLGVFNPK